MNKGFTVLESLMYLTCSVLLISLVASGFSILYTKSRERLTTANRFFDLILAADSLTKDIQQSTLISTLPTLRVEKANLQTTWLVRSGNLVRIGDKSTSLVARHIKSFVVLPYFFDGSIRGVTIKLTIADIPDRLQLALFIATRPESCSHE